MRSKAVIIAGAAAFLVVGSGTIVLVTRSGDKPLQLASDDFGRTRQEVLAHFPRGVPVSDVASGLTSIGFRCAPTKRTMANISAPSVQCDSAGRGYPTASRMEVTVMGRNGAVTDIAVGNGVDAVEADARSPNPNPGGALPLAATERR